MDADKIKNHLRISIIIPILNEENNIKPLYEKICSEIVNFDWELIYVDDGSSDNSFSIMRELLEKNRNIKIIKFKHNYGQPAAMRSALDLASGDLIAFMDGDGQFEPKDVEKLCVFMISNNYDLVSGCRVERQDKWLDCFFSKMGNYCINKTLSVKQSDYGSLKVFSKGLINKIKEYHYKNLHIYSVGYYLSEKYGETPIDHKSRISGQSKWNVIKRLSLYIEMWISFNAFPLRILYISSTTFIVFNFFYFFYYYLQITADFKSLLLILFLTASSILMFCLTIVIDILIKVLTNSMIIKQSPEIEAVFEHKRPVK